jgi:hypothetical protein
VLEIEDPEDAPASASPMRMEGGVGTIALRVDPRGLANPDLDIRHTLPDLLAEQCGGLSDDGYDYVGDPPYLLIFLKSEDVERAIGCILEVIKTCSVLENNLRDSVVVAADRGYGYEVAYPARFRGLFPM